MCEVTAPLYSDPRWQLKPCRLEDSADTVNWPIVARYLAHHAEQRRLAEEAAQADEPAASGKPKRRKPLPE